MATYRGQFPDLYMERLAFLEEVLFDELDLEDGVVSQVIRIKDTDKPFVRTTTVASFGMVPVKQEGAPVDYDDLAQGYDKTYTPDTYELAFKTSKEALDDEQEEVVSDAARALGESFKYTYNVDHANLYNDGFTSTTGSPDGVVLFSASHPLVGGGTGSNTFATQADLSIQSLRDALNVIADTTDDAGKLVHWRPKVLLVPYELKWLAKEILNSADRPDTADRATNVMKDEGLRLVSWPYLTDPDAWFLLDEPSKINVRSYWREKANVMHDWDFDSSAFKVKIRGRWIRGWSEWRRTFGSSGA